MEQGARGKSQKVRSKESWRVFKVRQQAVGVNLVWWVRGPGWVLAMVPQLH